MNSLKTILVILTVYIFYESNAQVDCNTLDVKKSTRKMGMAKRQIRESVADM
jgi:hypothetical protein